MCLPCDGLYGEAWTFDGGAGWEMELWRGGSAGPDPDGEYSTEKKSIKFEM